MRVVVDTNVLISGLFFPESHPGQVIRGWLSGSFEVLLSRALVAEYAEVLLRPKFDRFGSPEVRLRRLLRLASLKNCLVVGERDSLPEIPEVRDIKDAPFVECALRGRADVLVTGDKDLLALGSFGGVRVLAPGEFLDGLCG